MYIRLNKLGVTSRAISLPILQRTSCKYHESRPIMCSFANPSAPFIPANDRLCVHEADIQMKNSERSPAQRSDFRFMKQILELRVSERSLVQGSDVRFVNTLQNKRSNVPFMNIACIAIHWYEINYIYIYILTYSSRLWSMPTHCHAFDTNGCVLLPTIHGKTKALEKHGASEISVVIP